jgi:branched-chain amino acid transport system substrate-binding protein
MEMTKIDRPGTVRRQRSGRAWNGALLRWPILLLAVLVSGACIPQNFVVSPLGTVVVGPGEDIQIRSAAVLSSIGELGSSTQRAVALALADYGPIKGHNVTMGAGLDSLCTPEGGAAAAQTVIGDRRVVGVIGTSCSAAAVKASPILSEAGLVMLSATNTAPSLTSDLRGNAGAEYYRGYYRTANNDLYEAEAVAKFAYHDLGLREMAVFHDGDPYTSGLANAFTVAFEQWGGTVMIATVNKGDTDMIPVLTQVAAASPDGLFLPLFPDEGAQIIRQIGQIAGLDAIPLIGGAAMLDFEFLAIPESEGMYLASPELHFEDSVNEATGKSGGDIAAAYQEQYNEAPGSVYMAHAYDATTMLLRAIEEVAVAQGDTLYIDRARLREALTGTADFSGIVGQLNCDEFGDCGTGRVQISQHTDSTMTDVERLPVVYRYAP